MKTLIRAVAPVVALVLALAGCSSSGSSSSSDGHNDADVEFASEMVPHHEQALRMVAMTRGRDLSPQLEGLTQQIRAAQAPEIRTMEGWLDDWGEEADDDGHMMDGDGGMMNGSGGMMGGQGGWRWMTGRDFHRLGGAPAQAFEDMWLRMMIRHHQGAVAMSRDEVEHGEFPASIALAQHIEDSQQAEIEQMRRMLAD
ncbi:hypothetical protein GCM10009844_04230 [Nocardioides koreensis]|uniref:DUF305 domain-containing protein n=1 Tax=Nocardioides koreensis TaxID=433651 RepID=A0ABP5KTT4_9ACTN